jgi:hypothetical protein
MRPLCFLKEPYRGSALCAIQSELLADHFAQRVRNFPVPRYGSLVAIARIAVHVVSLAVTHELASRLLQFPDQGLPLHTSNSTGCCWAAAGAGDRSCVTIKS